MKRRIFLTLIFFLSLEIFAADLKTAEGRIFAIEEFKRQVLAGNGGKEFSVQEREALNSLYGILEDDEYTAESGMDEITLEVMPYDIEKAAWPCRLRGKLFGGAYAFDRKVEIIYSNVLEKRYIEPSKMSPYQKENYELSVTEFEERLQGGEKILAAEVTFKIKHWLEASEYRFDPQEIRIYKNERRPRLVQATDDSENKDVFIVNPVVEHRSPREYKADSERVKKIMRAESKAKKESGESGQEDEGEEKFTGQKPRRSIYVAISTNKEELAFSGIQDEISKNSLNEIEGFLTWGFGKFVFGGMSIAFDLDTRNQSQPVYSFGALLGANATILSHIRPYVNAGARIKTDNSYVANLGGGIDLFVGYFMATFSYNYNWAHYLNTEDASMVLDEANTSPRYHSFSIGAGLTW